ncbi:Calcium load-activated calcium channel [Coemansia sp. RSA 2706]|nr:Calcium load-activated calcium channel [Coemansia sp. RSA 2711]KAJ1849492.1 Calcium load-activated calcium channel [Coemansia sp. RSA 2708]KAJ2300906.1 Calcium load-activated calcium channel [Coemansia sp. RSA 2706]KAJ2307081.1 Calcium load-activated calcium channel [Coemansia sp. RSA 2705]KAJ2313059.1 Calcium load-activated calcium channel [Coemansia sp. RSA 2704]KAJ2324115.1 Calcium load-activated calcium channel [Coemansia sp. RSA 2702]KAJ2362949.1 Calcium load-activated calcium channel
MNDFIAILALSLLTSGLSEALSYALVFRTEQFQRLKAKVTQTEARLDEEKGTAAGSGSGKHRQRRIAGLETQLADARRGASSLQMRTMLVVGLVQAAAIYGVSARFGGRAVATLPFEPFGLVRSLTHRGLPEDSAPAACSATFVFVLGGLAFRAALDRWLQLGLPKGNSLPAWVADPEAVLAGKK